MHDATGESTLIPASHIRTLLPQAGPWLERSLSEFSWQRWTIESIVEELLKGNLQLWAAREQKVYLFVVTEVVLEMTGKSVHVILGGGKLDRERVVLRHIGTIEEWAKGIGANSLVVWGRLGWKKMLAPHGYEFETAMFRRTFTERMN